MAPDSKDRLLEALSRAGVALCELRDLFDHYGDLEDPQTEHLELAQSWCQALECLQMLVGDEANRFGVEAVERKL